METIADQIHRATLAACIALFGVMFAAQIVIVLMRYIMGVGFLEMQDLVTYTFSSLVVLTIPLAMRDDRHVRVDILRRGFADARNARIDTAGHVIFTLPVFGLLLLNALPLVNQAWAIREGSRETGGLGGLYLVKSTLVIMCLLILLRAGLDLVARYREGAGDER